MHCTQHANFKKPQQSLIFKSKEENHQKRREETKKQRRGFIKLKGKTRGIYYFTETLEKLLRERESE